MTPQFSIEMFRRQPGDMGRASPVDVGSASAALWIAGLCLREMAADRQPIDPFEPFEPWPVWARVQDRNGETVAMARLRHDPEQGFHVEDMPREEKR